MKTVIIDIETSGLINPDKIHCVVCKDVSSGKVHVFRNLEDFRSFSATVDCWVGHNILSFDANVLNRFLPGCIDLSRCIDTLVVSRLLNFLLSGHSLEAWGERLGHKKCGTNIKDWSVWTQEIQDRCVADVHINFLLYKYFLPYITSPRWKEALRTEHDIAVVCQEIHDNGFRFDIDKARNLYDNISREVDKLNVELKVAFPRRSRLLREYTPKATKFGTISKSSVPRGIDDLSIYSIGSTFSFITWEDFNAGSPKQVVERLNDAGWKPTEKTKGHLDALRSRDRERLEHFGRYGWTITEGNLATLPADAPPAAQTLTRWLLLSSRKRKFEEWFKSYNANSKRIHPTITPIGTWTHRCSHSDPNVGNIPTEKPQDTQEIKDINNAMRSLWIADTDSFLVGVDADGIQLRILAHYMEDQRFIQALVAGDKEKQTDVHSLNAVALGSPCKGRRDAKTFVYAWLLGAGISKVAEILGCSRPEAELADGNFTNYYPGLKRIINEVVPADGRRGYISGIDGRSVLLSAKRLETNPVGCVVGGYLQNGEAIVMKKANIIWRSNLIKEGIWRYCKQVNFVHDEYITEVQGDLDLANRVATIQADAIAEAGDHYKLKCPMLGTKIVGRNWLEVH